MPNFYEFFAGGGMARCGLGPRWNCLLANDCDPKKTRAYAQNWGSDHLFECDVAALKTFQLPGYADLIWASFPCQDLSLAGRGAGFSGGRSAAFWPFWELVKDLSAGNRRPKAIVLENVYGMLTSNGGQDFRLVCEALSEQGYRFGAVLIDAAHFVPQSRPRLFIIACDKDVLEPNQLTDARPVLPWHSDAVVSAFQNLSDSLKAEWLWWKLPEAPLRNIAFADIIEDEPGGVPWHTPEQTRALIAMMSDTNLRKLESAKASPSRKVGAIYRRTRIEGGVKRQRAEVRFDDVAGCLRTPAGGSSRQLIVVVDGQLVRSRLISPRETARLMGLPDEYHLPLRYNDAYHLTGDGVVVPVVSFIQQHILDPLIIRAGNRVSSAA